MDGKVFLHQNCENFRELISRKLKKEVTMKNSRLKMLNPKQSNNLEVTEERKLGKKRPVSWTPRSVSVK